MTHETRYVETADGTYIAYQVIGDGPVDLVMDFHALAGNVDLIWDEPDWGGFLKQFTEFTRLILHDRRGSGASTRNVPPPNLETRAADLLDVLDAIGSDTPVLGAAASTGEIMDIVGELAGLQRRPAPSSLLATVLFTDIVDSTRKQAELGDRDWRALLLAHHGAVREALSYWGGAEHDTAGDGFFASFVGPARAIHCAHEIAVRVRDLGIETRAGVHIGECELIDGKPGGLAVTIGARLLATAGPQDVVVSQTVKDLVAGSGFAFADRGEHALKGVPGVWRLYAAEATA